MCVANVIAKLTRYKNNWAARIFEEWEKARFPKVATLEPSGPFKEYDLHKVQSLEIGLVQMDAFLKALILADEVCSRSCETVKERYPPKTLH